MHPKVKIKKKEGARHAVKLDKKKKTLHKQQQQDTVLSAMERMNYYTAKHKTLFFQCLVKFSIVSETSDVNWNKAKCHEME